MKKLIYIRIVDYLFNVYAFFLYNFLFPLYQRQLIMFVKDFLF